MENQTSIKGEDKRIRFVIIGLSVLIPSVVAFLLMMPQTGKLGLIDLRKIPSINAILNSLTSLMLILGLVFVKKRWLNLHRAMMISALVCSVLFLVLYVLYHFQVASTKFGGEGLLRAFYYFTLLTHILLAVIVVPFVLYAFYYAFTKQFDKHKKIVKYTYPIWLYVAISGVLVYLMISPYYG